jgi:hypothetical protein
VGDVIEKLKNDEKKKQEEREREKQEREKKARQKKSVFADPDLGNNIDILG